MAAIQSSNFAFLVFFRVPARVLLTLYITLFLRTIGKIQGRFSSNELGILAKDQEEASAATPALKSQLEEKRLLSAAPNPAQRN
jgi:hypothetical protein